MKQVIQVDINENLFALVMSSFFVALSFFFCWYKLVNKPSPPGQYKVLSNIKNRRSIFPKHYKYKEISKEIIENLIDAAMWAPFHGTRPPWYFVILNKPAMIKMQELTLEFYDNN